jgi:hypothetical protein
MKLRGYITAIAFAILLCAAGAYILPARAAIDAKGAAHLKTLFEEMLAQPKDAKKKGDSLKLDGEVMVEPVDNYYAVTLPHLSMISKDGSRMEVGIITLNVMPTDVPTQWKMTLALPSPVTFYDKSGAPEMQIAVMKQYFAGVWDEKFRNFTKLKAQYKDIRALSTDRKVNIAIPDFTATYDLKENAGKNLSGPMLFEVTGLQAAGPDGGKVSVGKIEYAVNLLDYSVDAAAAYRDNVAALSESYKSGEQSGNRAHVTGIYNLVTDFIGTVWDGFTSTLGARNIALSLPSAGGRPARDIKIADAALSFDMTGFRRNSVMLRAGMNYNGLSIAPLPDPAAGSIMPSQANVDISINNLPYREMRALGQTSVDAAVKAPQMAQLAGLQALMSLPQLFTKAGTNMVLKDTVFAGKDYRVGAAGTLTADMAAMKSAVGKGRMEIAGLEKLIAVTAEQLKNPKLNPARKAKLEKTASVLTTLQLAGQQGKDSTGAPARTYDFELTKDGKILMNGADIGLLMGKTPATPPPVPAPEKK